jgi:hypothetical protein
MGYIKHEAVIAEVSDEKIIRKIVALRREMKKDQSECGLNPGIIVGPVEVINGYSFFVFLPDGSKEGWDSSAKGDSWRERFLSLVKESEYPEYVHFQFGGDDNETIIYDTTDYGVKNQTGHIVKAKPDAATHTEGRGRE